MASSCCLLHWFLRTAARLPNHLAIIHAFFSPRESSVSHVHDQQLQRECEEHVQAATTATDQLVKNDGGVVPVFPRDVVYSYDELRVAVESLGCLLVRGLGLPTPGSSQEEEDEEPERQQLHPNIVSVSPKTVGIWMVQSAEYLVAVLAVLRAGAAFVPLDPSWPLERLKTVVTHSKVSLILGCRHRKWAPHMTAMEFSDALDASSSCTVLWLEEGWIKTDEKAGRHVHTQTWHCTGKRTFCYLLYTSGSSGTPKGVCGTEEGLMNRLQWMEKAYPYQRNDLACFKSSVGFVDHLTEALGPLLAGTPLLIPSPETCKENPLSLLSFVKLWKDLASAMPCTTILNLYGSTELSGDCTFFECPTFDGLSSSSKGPEVLDAAHELNSVPIGEPIDGHWLCIVLEDGKLAESGEEGELWVGGVGVANGYFDDTEVTCSKFMDLSQEKDWLDLNAMGVIGYTPVDTRVRVFKTGDMAKRLLTGSIALLGRKDRQIKIHGHRIALEEIEFILEQHPQVDQAAVSLVILGANSKAGLVAYVVIPDDTVLSNSSKEGTSMVSGDVATHEGQMSLEESLIWWLKERVTAVMIPQQFIRLKAMPLTNSGKIDHSALPKPLLFQQPYISKFGKHKQEESMQGLDYVREVFAHVLMANKEVLAADNFFAMGGTSISAAHAAFVLGVNMHMIYAHPTAWQLCQAMGGVSRGNRLMCFGSEQRGVDEQLVQLQSEREKNSHGRSISLNRVSDLEAVQSSEDEPQNRNLTLGKKRKHEETTKVAQMAWPAFISKPGATAFLRSNKSVDLQSEAESRASQVQDIVLEEVPEKEDWSLQQCWRVSLQACVDASPLLVIHGDTCRIFIGSHSHNFMSVDAISGEVQWEVQLTGRVESSAAITHDFSQVKCQPTLDTWQGWIWCGSHDHHIYALDAMSHTCVWQHSCGGSIFGAPAFDQVRKMVYVAATTGVVTAVKLEPSVDAVWKYTCAAPVFGSLAIDLSTGLVLCTGVDGSVVALTHHGSLAWQVNTNSPIFAGACISSALSSQVLVCSRDGHIYSLSMHTGKELWKHDLGDAITGSAWVDESIMLSCSDNTGYHHRLHRIVCVATSTGTVHVLSVETGAEMDTSHSHIVANDNRTTVQSQCIASTKLPGEVFSSPVMVEGRIFVGCRDNFIYSLDLFVGGKALLVASIDKYKGLTQ
ncbi:hypothetical protein CY35_02G057700 [Sphagnum magellanicum]|nr:hypothetical protein CY35_02G057700 [Sphagnum magellanicum]